MINCETVEEFLEKIRAYAKEYPDASWEMKNDPKQLKIGVVALNNLAKNWGEVIIEHWLVPISTFRHENFPKKELAALTEFCKAATAIKIVENKCLSILIQKDNTGEYDSDFEKLFDLSEPISVNPAAQKFYEGLINEHKSELEKNFIKFGDDEK